MINVLAIFQYFVLSITDIFDKFLISKRKIEPINYTFFTVVTGMALAVIWPWVYHSIPVGTLLMDMLAGACFSVSMFIFFSALAQDAVSRVVPFVFGLVPVFDIVIGTLTGKTFLSIQQISAMCVLIPGALLISYKKDNFRAKHMVLKLVAAMSISTYNLLWHYASSTGPVLNNLLWNRTGAALVLVLPLCLPIYRAKVFTVHAIEKKQHTSFLFLFKQALGGGNFILTSYLYSVGVVAVIDALQGFRYVFLFLASFFLSKRKANILDDTFVRHDFMVHVAALGLICVGTIILFL